MPHASHARPTAYDHRLETPECPDSGIPAGSVPLDPRPGRSSSALSDVSILLPCFDEENVADAIRSALSAQR